MITIKNPNTGEKKSHQTTSIIEARKKINHLKSNTTWSQLNQKKRIYYLLKFQKELKKNRDHIQHILSTETGKPSWESATEINAAINKLNATLESQQYRCHYPNHMIGRKRIHTKVKPIGIIGIIGPFNFPIHIPNGQIIPALLTGNCVIVKSSEYTIDTTKAIQKCWATAFSDIPSPIEFIYGDKAIGKELVNNSEVDAIFFTGSSTVGMQIERECLKLRKPCALEMGGNNAIIIEDTHPNLIEHLTASSFITAGQRCTCARRIIINKRHEGLVEKWINHIKKLSLAAYPSQSKPFMGPVVLEKIKKTILNETFKDSETLLKAENIGPGGLLSPRIEYSKKGHDSEIFGPIAFIQLVDSLESAIEIVNESNFGLSCSVYSKSKRSFNHAVKTINTGIINWNTPTTGASGLAPFGGTKQSGNHKPGGFNMIDHCVIPTALNEQKQPNKLYLPGTDA